MSKERSPTTPTRAFLDAQKAAILLGKLGGKAGKGKAKARDPKLMSEAGKKGAKARWEKASWTPEKQAALERHTRKAVQEIDRMIEVSRKGMREHIAKWKKEEKKK